MARTIPAPNAPPKAPSKTPPSTHVNSAVPRALTLRGRRLRPAAKEGPTGFFDEIRFTLIPAGDAGGRPNTITHPLVPVRGRTISRPEAKPAAPGRPPAGHPPPGVVVPAPAGSTRSLRTVRSDASSTVKR